MHTLRWPSRPAVIALLALTVAAPDATAQIVDDSIVTARLAALGRVWAAVKYFHPALATRPVDWDSAIVAAIPRVRAATTRDEYASAVDEMLAALGDPATHIVGEPHSAVVTPAGPMSSAWVDDSTFLVTVPDPTDYTGAITMLSAARADLARARRVIFDLRTHGVDRERGYTSYIFGTSGIQGLLTTVPIAMPSVRTRMYSGFPPQVGSTSGDYWSGFSIRSGDIIAPAADNTTPRRTAFIVDSHSDLPEIALALRHAGIGVIVAEGVAGDIAEGGDTWFATLADSVQVAVRVSEWVNPDGSRTTGMDTIVVPSDSTDRALAVARTLLRAPARTRAAASAEQPFVPQPERGYAGMQPPTLEYRLLAVFRFWSAIHYFYPYKSLMDEDWDSVLEWAIPKFEAADDSLGYVLAVAELVTKIHDSHGFVGLQSYFGPSQPPLRVRYIEDEPVVTQVSQDTTVRATGIRVGDVIVSIDGEAAQARRARLEPYLPSSTPQALDAVVALVLLGGAEGSTATLVVRGADDRDREVRILRTSAAQAAIRWTHSGPPWRILPGNIGYVDLEKLTAAQVDSMFEALKDTRALIIDNRIEFLPGNPYAIAARLTDEPNVVGARNQRPLVTSPDTVTWSAYGFARSLPPVDKWRYRQPTVMLMDERTISRAEDSGLFFEAAAGTTFIGSPTTGANGDVTNVMLSGGVVATFTGHDVRHADGRQLQRVGLQPDVFVRPTIAGIRAGRDEVLERAVRYLQTGR